MRHAEEPRDDPPARTGPRLPLDGRTVVVTASRRRAELVTLLERKGALVVGAPTMRTVPLTEDSALLEATRSCLEAPLDVAIATTGSGLSGWLDAAGEWELRDRLVGALGAARLLCRGPKSKGALRAAGLTEEWSPSSEASQEVLDHLLAEDVSGQRIAVQLHGDPFLTFTTALREAGATVIEIPVYRWELPADLAPVRELVGTLISGQADAVVFTSAPAVNGLVTVAEDLGRREELLAALGTTVIAACVGPITAAPLERHGIRTLQPQRARVVPLVATLAEAMKR